MGRVKPTEDPSTTCIIEASSTTAIHCEGSEVYWEVVARYRRSSGPTGL